MKNFKRLFSVLIIVVLFVFFVTPFNVRAITSGYGTYNESQMLDRTNLGYGISYYKSIGRTSSTVRSGENNQTVYYLNTPSTDAVRVVSWANFVNNKWKMTTVRNLALDFEAKNPGWKVIAGINGDFFDINGTGNFQYQTSGGVAYEGNFYKTGGGNTLGFTNDGSEDSLIWGYNPSETSFILDVFNENEEIISSFEVQKTNLEPGTNETAVYFGTYNSYHIYDSIKPNTNSMLAKFYVEDAELTLPNSTSDFYGKGVITSLSPEEIGAGQFAVVTNNQEVASALAIGKEIRVQKEWTGAFSNVQYATGSGTMLMDNGVVPTNVNTVASVMNAAHPRTAIGRKADGSIVMAVVDGRVDLTVSAGVYGDELAAIMANAGCVEAYNLDGGGSSTMVIRENGVLKTVNVPSDGRERSDSNAILVVTKEPDVSVQMTDATDKTIDIAVDVIDSMGHQFDALYATINGSDQEIIDGKATFSDLRANTEYTCKLFYKLGNRKIEFLKTYKFITTVTPHSFFRVEFSKGGGNYYFEVKYRDRDNETNLPVADLIINNQTYKLVSGKVTIPITEIGEINSLEIRYIVANSLGTKTITINNPDSTSLRFIEELFQNKNRVTGSIFK